MTAARVIAIRELASYYRLPGGWVILALWAFLAGVLFALLTLRPGQPADMQEFFSIAGWLMLPVAPAITMRLLAEELRSGTIEPLMTSPLGSTSLVMGKFLGAVLFTATLLAMTLPHVALLWSVSDPRPDIGRLASGYLGLVLLSVMCLSLGTLASACTANATLAFLLAFFTMLTLLFAGAAADLDFVPDAVKPGLYSFSISARLADFARGVLDTSNVVFFLTAAAWMLLLAVVVTERRRWL